MLHCAVHISIAVNRFSLNVSAKVLETSKSSTVRQFKLRISNITNCLYHSTAIGRHLAVANVANLIDWILINGPALTFS